MSTVKPASIVDVATLFPASLIGTALAQLWIADQAQSLLVPVQNQSGVAASCPLTRKPIKQPVLLADGCIYEEEAICNWLSAHSEAPGTHATLDHLCALRLEPLRWAIEYFLLRTSSDMNSRNLCSLKRAMTDAERRDLSLAARVHGLNTALSQAQAASEELRGGIDDARLLLVKLSAELSGARNTALEKVHGHVKSNILQHCFGQWCNQGHRRQVSAVLRMQYSWRCRQRRRKRVEQAARNELVSNLYASKRQESLMFRDLAFRKESREMQFGYAVATGSSIGSTASPTKQSTTDSLAGYVQRDFAISEDSPGCPFSMSHRHEASDVIDRSQACASCHKSDVVLFACKKCLAEYYCSFHCQQNRWAEHKAFCVAASTKHRNSFVQIDCGGGLQSGQGRSDKQIGRTVVPGSGSSRGSGPTSRCLSIPGSWGSSHGFQSQGAPSSTPLAMTRSGDSLPDSSQRLVPASQQEPFRSSGSMGSMPGAEAAGQYTMPKTDVALDPTVIPTPIGCLECGRHFWTRPPGGICDDCFKLFRAGLPAHHCIAHCDRCGRIVDDVLDPLGVPTCAHCSQIVDPTCAHWREGQRAPSSHINYYASPAAPRSKEVDSPVGCLDSEPPRIENDLSTLLAGLGERMSDSPLEPTVEAALAASGPLGLPDSPNATPVVHERSPSASPLAPEEPCSSAPSGEYVHADSLAALTLHDRLRRIFQETGLVGTDNLMNDARLIAREFGIPCTTLNEVITGCEAALGLHHSGGRLFQ